MKKLLIGLLCLFGCFQIVEAQLRYPVVGKYKGESAQGMAIWGDKAYLFNNGGHCRILDLKTEVVVGNYSLMSSGKDNHVNNASFGCEHISIDKKPVLYISETNGQSRCFVEQILDTCSVLVQTLQIREKGKYVFVQSWVIDRDNKVLYTIARMPKKKGELGSKKIRIDKYRLPKLEEGDFVILREKDRFERFFVEFASGTQGAFIKGNYMYVASGLQESAKGRFNAARCIQVIDLKKKKIAKRIDLTYVTVNEPEGIDLYNGKVMLFCGQEGGIYEVDMMIK